MVRRSELLSELNRVIVAVDPAVTHGEDADDTGIVVVGRGPHRGDRCAVYQATGRCPGHGYVLADLTCHVAPHEWARRAVAAYDEWRADRIVAEVNNGGEMVGEVLHAVRAGVSYGTVTASRGKHNRAEPVAALDEQGRLHYVGHFAELETELTTWTQDAKWSPNRLDAMVWGLTALGLIGGQGEAFLSLWRSQLAGQWQPKHGPEAIKARQERSRSRELARTVAAMPHFSGSESKPLARGCAHRWRSGATGTTCVMCGGSR